jgi:O-methyltransferase involved in polyketide biosynthesis
MEHAPDAVGDPPSNLTYVSIDFQHDDLGDVLAPHGCESIAI